MSMLLNAFFQGLLIGAIIASMTVVIYFVYLKLTSLDQPQSTDL